MTISKVSKDESVFVHTTFITYFIKKKESIFKIDSFQFVVFLNRRIDPNRPIVTPQPTPRSQSDKIPSVCLSARKEKERRVFGDSGGEL